MSLASGDLTTFAAVKGWVTDPAPADAQIPGLISRVSMMIRGYLNRPLLIPKTYVEQYNGQGTAALIPYNFPIIGATVGLVSAGLTIPLAPQLNQNNSVNTSPPLTAPFGYRMQPWNGVPPGDPAVIELVGGRFPYGNQNIVITYRAGYEVVDESATVPAAAGPYTVTPLTPYGVWATDEGVTLADGTVLIAIANGSPASGQYLPPDPGAAAPRLTYTFNAAQASAAVLLSYGYIPSDLEQVALEIIAERNSYRRRVGLQSQSLAAQESIAYGPIGGRSADGGLNAWAKTALQAYVNVLPPSIGASV